MSVFPNAHNFIVNSSSFANVTGNYIQTTTSEQQKYAGLEILFQKSVFGASYNSEQRFPPPNCHPGTRTRILEMLRRWITATDYTTASVYWLYGAAGIGKSAIAQTISEEFETSRLAASFFFGRADSSRNNLLSFFITIAYQLARSCGPPLKGFIDAAARNNPEILHAALQDQLQELILEPCSRLTVEEWEGLPQLIVIDGLDECVDIASQERLLSIIRQIKATTSPLPFRFLICSRPEPRIRNAFSHQDFHSVLDCIDIGESAFESGKDIAQFLRQEFGRIRQEHGPTMAHVPEDWPGSGIIQQLVRKACGQFIYAATVIKYIGDYDGYPVERLVIILNITVPDGFDSPYPDLDLLYLQILSACPKRELKLLLEVIAHILNPGVFFRDPFQSDTSPFTIAGLFSLDKGEVWALLSRLHSVLFIPDTERISIRARHASAKPGYWP